MLETRKDLKERIEALEARSGELEDELTAATEEAKSKSEELEASNAARDEAIANLNDQAEALAEAEAKVAELEADNAALSEKLDDEAPRIAEAAAAQLAEAGHEPLAVTDETVTAITPEQVREQFDAMPAGEERSAFYQKHRSVLAK